MITGFFRGLSYPIRGARMVYVTDRSLMLYAAVPIVLTLVALFSATWGALSYGSEVLSLLWAEPSAQGVGGMVLGALHWLLGWAVAVLLAAAGIFLAVGISNVLVAPFNDALSEQVERHVTGGVNTLGDIRFRLRDAGRTIRLEATKLTLYLGLIGPLFAISLLVPGPGQIAYSLGATGISIVYVAVDYVDWPAARRDWSVRRRLGLFRMHPGELLGFGVGVWLMLLVPVLNLFFMPAAVAGGTLLFLEVFAENGKSGN